jgi:hypothetical protein
MNAALEFEQAPEGTTALLTIGKRRKGRFILANHSEVWISGTSPDERVPPAVLVSEGVWFSGPDNCPNSSNVSIVAGASCTNSSSTPGSGAGFANLCADWSAVSRLRWRSALGSINILPDPQPHSSVRAGPIRSEPIHTTRRRILSADDIALFDKALFASMRVVHEGEFKQD